jgi:hypothetical protein
VKPSPAAGSRLVFAIAHYWSEDSSTLGARRSTAEQRATMLRRVIATLHETFGGARKVSPGVDVGFGPERTIKVLVVTTDDGSHLIDRLAAVRPLFSHVERHIEDPRLLPFECRSVLAEHLGEFDEYAALEDDIIVADPMFFDKLHWFRAHAGSDAVLMPNRFERLDGLKAYIDPVLSPQETASFQDLGAAREIRLSWTSVGEVVLRQVDNPHASCWFVSAEQMARWSQHPGFATPSDEFISPLESAMCPAVGGPFRLYKPVAPRPDYLEVEHVNHAYLEMWALPDDRPAGAVSADRNLERMLEAAIRERDEAIRRAAEWEAAYASLLASPTMRLTRPIRLALRRVLPRRSSSL